MSLVVGSSHYVPGLGHPALPISVRDFGEITIIHRGIFTGPFVIVGTTKNLGSAMVAVGRKVRLHDQPSGRVVAEMWSDSVTGEFEFKNLSAGTYYVTSFDHTGQYAGVIETDIVPVSMA